jgi:hypothetical protein
MSAMANKLGFIRGCFLVAQVEQIRTAPPSGEPNNQDVFIWALYVLGGADKDVDVEEVYLKSFELAPARLGWRTHPEIPDYKKTAKALQSIEAATHVGLVHRTSAYLRRLTVAGVHWVETYKSILEGNYSGEQPVRAAATNEHERRRVSLKSAKSFIVFLGGNTADLFDLADAFECSAASPGNVWKGRIEEAHRTADVLQDKELMDFVEYARSFIQINIGGYR